MSTPQTINGLMRHLRNDCNVNINGSYQKQQLVSYGYYHGYKGYRFFARSNNPIPYTDFSEVVAVIEYDNNLKAAFYPELMFIETAIKNIVCNESICGLKNGTFEYLYKERMSDNPGNTNLLQKRLRLRNSVFSKLSEKYQREENSDNQMIRHFYNRGEDAPLWVVFEILYLSDLACFFECLNTSNRTSILNALDMLDVSIDTNRNLLTQMLYTLKSLRNAVAHNNIVFDTRFKDRNVSNVLKRWLEKETGINNITLYSLIDYVILMCCILKRVDFSNTRAKKILDKYEAENSHLQSSVTPSIYSQIISSSVATKISGLKTYLDI